MKTARWIYWSAQIGGWSVYATLLLFANYQNSPEKFGTHIYLKVVGFEILAIICTHLLRYLYLKLDWLNLKLAPLIPRVLLAILLYSFGFTFFNELLNYAIDIEYDHQIEVSNINYILEILSFSTLLLFWNGFYFTYHFFSKSRNQEISNLILEANRNEMELKNLRSQLNPHFLFNSLNSIRALIEISPIEAKNAVTSMSNLLRKSLVHGKQNLIPMHEELEMVMHYLELEKIRFEERLRVVWLVDDTLKDTEIPPFCLQMLVENAIKHGISKLMTGGEIEIKIGQTEQIVYIVVENSGVLGSSKDIGIGIENTKRRLDLQFKERASFDIQQGDGKVISTIKFKK